MGRPAKRIRKKTDQTGSQAAKRSKVSNTQTDNENDLRSIIDEELFKKLWKIHHISPLKGFRYDTVYLKHFEKQIGNSVLNTAYDQQGDDDNPDKVTITLLQEDGNTNQIIPIKIEVTRNAEDRSKILFTAVLLPDNKQSNENIVSLPLMLTSGIESLRRKVVDVLEGLFGTVVIPVLFPGVDLLKLSLEWCALPQTKAKEIKFHYKVPTIGSNIVELQMDTKVILKLHEKIAAESDNDYDAFHEAIEKHINKTHGFNLHKCTLKQVELPAVTIGSSGKIRMNVFSSINPILKWLSDRYSHSSKYH